MKKNTLWNMNAYDYIQQELKKELKFFICELENKSSIVTEENNALSFKVNNKKVIIMVNGYNMSLEVDKYLEYRGRNLKTLTDYLVETTK